MIAHTAIIHPLAYIESNVEIGANTKIGPFCIVRNGAKIGSDCKFTAYCEIRENVIIGDGTTMGSRCTISANATIGKNTTIKYGFVFLLLFRDCNCRRCCAFFRDRKKGDC